MLAMCWDLWLLGHPSNSLSVSATFFLVSVNGNGKALVLAASSKFLHAVSGQTPTDYSKNPVPQFIFHWTRTKMLEKRTKQTRGRKHLMLPWTHNTVHHPSSAWQLC